MANNINTSIRSNSQWKSKTLFIRNLSKTTSNDQLISTFEEVGPVKTGFVVTDKGSGTCKGFGYVKFSMLEDAVKAVETITHCDGKKIFLTFADAKKERKEKQSPGESSQESGEPSVAAEASKIRRSTNTKQKPLKRCRIIVRNLAFKCKESHLRAHFEKFGDISEVTIPLKDGSLNRGFAFIQFTQLQAAQKAITEMNSQEIMGRPVAVDWAVAKDRYMASTTQQESPQDSASVEEEKLETGSLGVEEDPDRNTADESSSMDETSAEEDDSDVDDDDDDHDDDDDNDDDEDDDDVDRDNEESSKSMPVKRHAARKQSDVAEGRTVFVRNIPFEADEEEVKEAFLQFGDLVYVRLVCDRISGQPKGTAFVQFVDKDSADQCLELQKQQSIIIQGRSLAVMKALTPAEVQGQKDTKKIKEQMDNRNLFLAREGLIRAGTQAAIGISEEDMKKRMKDGLLAHWRSFRATPHHSGPSQEGDPRSMPQRPHMIPMHQQGPEIELVKREKLKNINIFVSSTRLCVHNLPPRVDEKELKKVLRQSVDDSSMKITECRVMRDLNRTNQAGMSKSLCYAFVNFTTHEHALKALQKLNNSTVFGNNRRPIVEFSLENKKVLEMKQKRLEKSKAQAAKMKDSTVAKEGRRQQQKPDKTQDHIAKAMHRGAPKGMPKRFGPKIRHRDRKQRQKGKKMKQRNEPSQPPAPEARRKRKGKDATDKHMKKRKKSHV